MAFSWNLMVIYLSSLLQFISLSLTWTAADINRLYQRKFMCQLWIHSLAGNKDKNPSFPLLRLVFYYLFIFLFTDSKWKLLFIHHPDNSINVTNQFQERLTSSRIPFFLQLIDSFISVSWIWWLAHESSSNRFETTANYFSNRQPGLSSGYKRFPLPFSCRCRLSVI